MPPQATEFEEAVLGALMVQKDAIDRVLQLEAKHFYNDINQLIFQAIYDLHSKSHPIDMLTVTDMLTKQGKLDIVGGMFAIAQLTSKVSSGANIEYHSAVIMQKYALRQIIATSHKALTDAYSDGADPEEIQSSLFTELEQTQFKNNTEPAPLNKVASEFLKELKEIQDSGKFLTGIDTGYQKVNIITNGWRPPNLMVLAARPGTGKTALALNIVYKIISQNIPCAFFSLEMSSKELMGRLVSISAGISSDRLRNADLSITAWNSIHETSFNLPLYIDDTSSLSIMQFKAKARKLSRKHGVKFIVVDYLQLMTAPMVKGNREQEIGLISRTLKAVAKELNVPILALAQLSRDVEKRGSDAKPRLSDLRECLSIETSQIYGNNYAQGNSNSQMNLLSLHNNKIQSMQSSNIPKTSTVVYRLKTRTGRFVDCTANHPILTTSGYKQLKDITSADSIALACGWGNDTEGVDVPEAKFIGWMIGNGCMYGYNVPSFITNSKEVSDAFVQFVVDRFGFEPKNHPHYASKVYQWDITKNSVRVPGGNPVTTWLKDTDLWGKKAKDKVIPEWFICNANTSSIIKLIEGLWETDGSIPLGRKPTISYATTSIVLANQILYLLAKLGIIASVDKGYSSELSKSPCYKVIVSANAQQMRFKSMINLLGKKGEALRSIQPVAGHSNALCKVNRDTTLEIAKITYGISKSNNRVQTHGGRRLTIPSLVKLLEVYPEQLASYKWLTSDSIFWDGVASIEEIGEVPVFDRNVPKSHNFVVNGIIVHNSGAIEQDADAVMFMYDPNKEDKTVYETPIEIIWAKHRGGACLSTDLMFHKPTQRFTDII
jgi:replicative DNA helicase